MYNNNNNNTKKRFSSSTTYVVCFSVRIDASFVRQRCEEGNVYVKVARKNLFTSCVFVILAREKHSKRREAEDITWNGRTKIKSLFFFLEQTISLTPEAEQICRQREKNTSQI